MKGLNDKPDFDDYMALINEPALFLFFSIDVIKKVYFNKIHKKKPYYGMNYNSLRVFFLMVLSEKITGRTMHHKKLLLTFFSRHILNTQLPLLEAIELIRPIPEYKSWVITTKGLHFTKDVSEYVDEVIDGVMKRLSSIKIRFSYEKEDV